MSINNYYTAIYNKHMFVLGSQVIGGSPNGAILINLSLPAGMCEQGDIIFGVEGLGP